MPETILDNKFEFLKQLKLLIEQNHKSEAEKYAAQEIEKIDTILSPLLEDIDLENNKLQAISLLSFKKDILTIMESPESEEIYLQIQHLQGYFPSYDDQGIENLPPNYQNNIDINKPI